MSDTKLYDSIFGSDSVGANVEDRAASSSRIFVRSQFQIAEDNPLATGHRLTAYEALGAFGLDVLRRISEDGSCPIIKKMDEPSQTLRSRRNDLNLTARNVAQSAGIDVSVVEKAERAGEESPFQDLQRIAQVLALDERVLGFILGAHGDHNLSVRLREMAHAADAKKFSPAEVVGLAEAAWVIARQSILSKTNGEPEGAVSQFRHSSDYAYPTYRKGYDLALTTRKKLSIPQDSPIDSLKSFIEDRLGVPVAQLQLGENFAGATVANGESRGIVINEHGANSNVWVRRMTLAHEVGHLLWDPDARLDKLRVDSYEDVDAETPRIRQTDVVEIRANAFAIAFLAPPSGVEKIMKDAQSNADGVAKIMTYYGISATAARHHIKNVTQIDVSNIHTASLPNPSADWIARENLAVDYFKPDATPISRRGKFALLVAKAFKAGKITSDTAASYLRCEKADFNEHADFIISVLTG
jgi:Zn-dependent peptidase ImmA (M78 family)/transcriptional regulator with XRE-family HTH domain